MESSKNRIARRMRILKHPHRHLTPTTILPWVLSNHGPSHNWLRFDRKPAPSPVTKAEVRLRHREHPGRIKGLRILHHDRLGIGRKIYHSTMRLFAAHAHRIGVVLFAPAAASAGIPPEVNRAAGWEARNRAGMAGAHRSTVEVLASHAGADPQPVFQVLTPMAPP